VVTYAWGSYVTDHDYGTEWRGGAGLCSRVLDTGGVAWYIRVGSELNRIQPFAPSRRLWAIQF
jgi:hypothetical protein